VHAPKGKNFKINLHKWDIEKMAFCVLPTRVLRAFGCDKKAAEERASKNNGDI